MAQFVGMKSSSTLAQQVASALKNRLTADTPPDVRLASLAAQEQLASLPKEELLEPSSHSDFKYRAWKFQIKNLQTDACNGNDNDKLNYGLEIAKLISSEGPTIEKNIIDDAIKHLKHLTKQGNSEATRAFETIVFNQRCSGKRVEIADIQEAIKSLRQEAVNANNNNNNNNNKYMFAALVWNLSRNRPELVDQSEIRDAFEFNKKAAQNGHAGAQCLIGIFLESGWGCERPDLASALYWYYQSGDQGNIPAQDKFSAASERIKANWSDRSTSI